VRLAAIGIGELGEATTMAVQQPATMDLALRPARPDDAPACGRICLVDLLGLRREHQDVGIGELVQTTADLDAVQARKHRIEHHQIGVTGPRQVGGRVIQRV
jgi:hypothetical protein